MISKTIRQNFDSRWLMWLPRFANTGDYTCSRPDVTRCCATVMTREMYQNQRLSPNCPKDRHTCLYKERYRRLHWSCSGSLWSQKMRGECRWIHVTPIRNAVGPSAKRRSAKPMLMNIAQNRRRYSPWPTANRQSVYLLYIYCIFIVSLFVCLSLIICIFIRIFSLYNYSISISLLDQSKKVT